MDGDNNEMKSAANRIQVNSIQAGIDLSNDFDEAVTKASEKEVEIAFKGVDGAKDGAIHGAGLATSAGLIYSMIGYIALAKADNLHRLAIDMLDGEHREYAQKGLTGLQSTMKGIAKEMVDELVKESKRRAEEEDE